MKGSKDDMVKYRLMRAKDTLDDARILADNQKFSHQSPIVC